MFGGGVDGYFILPRRRVGIPNWGSISRKRKNCDLDVLAVRWDFGDISDVEKVSTPKQDSGAVELIMLKMSYRA